MNKNKRAKINWYSKKHGITLISLVITIVVLLILAGVAVSISVGDGSVTQHAQNATEQWNAKVNEEQISIDEALGYLGIEPATQISDQMPAGKGWDNSATGPIDKVATQSGKIAPIPKGYTVSQVPGEGSISGGMVVYQIPTGATVDWANNQITLSGETTAKNLQENVNQYVWIPVDDINDMVMCKRNGTAGTGGSTCNLVYDVASNQITCQTHNYTTATALTYATIDTTGLAGRSYGTNSSTTDAEKPKIYTTDMAFTEASKAAHRFAANSTYSDSKYREPDLVVDKDNSNYQLVLNELSEALTSSEELKHQLNNKFIEMAVSVAKYGGFYISRYEAGYENNWVISKKNQNVLTSATSVAGPYYLAGDQWYGLYNKTLTCVEKGESVNSHMIWGCQYDQVIKFLGKEKGETGHNYQTPRRQLTGYVDDQDILNNIYDLEGNNYEWTAQAYGTNGRVERGNYYSEGRLRPLLSSFLPRLPTANRYFQLLLYASNSLCETVVVLPCEYERNPVFWVFMKSKQLNSYTCQYKA